LEEAPTHPTNHPTCTTTIHPLHSPATIAYTPPPPNPVQRPLELLIVIIGERWMPGVSMVTEEDRLRKEIIQLLCTKSYSHSELSRALPDGNSGNSDNIFEDVINTVAVFKKPVGVESKGVYELKEHLFDEFNVYFYHYTKEDKSKAEELQRERRKAKKELVCCPPPMLPQLTPAFT